MHLLELHSVSDIDELAHPASVDSLTLASPARLFFTDFLEHEPLVLDDSVRALDARRIMIRTHVRLKLVIDHQRRFVGTISAEQLSEQAIAQCAERSTRNPSDVQVADLMTRKQSLSAFDILEVDKSTIGDVVHFLQGVHQQHCLVLDTAEHRIRGIFSASDISRRLKLPVDIQQQSSFASVFSAVS